MLSTEFVAPDGPSYNMADAGVQRDINIRGVATVLVPGEPDTVKIWCYADNGGVAGRELLDTVTVRADGTFALDNVDLPWGMSAMCTVRALPAADDPRTLADETEPLDLSPFEGLRIGIGVVDPVRLTAVFGLPFLDDAFVAAGLRGDELGDFDVVTQQPAGSWSLGSLATTAVAGSRLYSGTNFAELPVSVFDGVGVLDRATWNGVPSIAVDGEVGYTTGSSAALLGTPVDGLTPLEVARRDLDAVTGDFAFGESHSVRRCEDDDDDVEEQPDYDLCEQLGATGVQLERTYATGAGGRRLTVTDVLTSTDGREHTVDLAYQNDFAGTPRFAFGDGVFEPHDKYSEVTLGGSPSSVIVDRDDALADGDPASSTGGITYPVVPQRVVFDGTAGYVAQFRRTVPASGSATVTHVLTQARTIEEARRLAAQAEADHTPRSAPPRTAPPASPGPAPGPARRTATPPQTQDAPPSATAARRLCRLPRLVRRRARSAREALARAGCAVGRLRYVRTSRLAPYRIVRQGVRRGARVALGTKVDLVVSKKILKKRKKR